MRATATENRKEVSFHILDKEYCLACEEHERAALVEAVEFLNERINEMRSQSRVAVAERIAVMAAVHLAYDILLERRVHKEDDSQIDEGISRIKSRIENALASVREPNADSG